MIRIHIVPVLGLNALIEVTHGKPSHCFGPLFATYEDAQVFRLWLERYRESSLLDPPVDLQVDMADALRKFAAEYDDWNLGDVLSPADILDAFLVSDGARAAMSKAVA